MFYLGIGLVRESQMGHLAEDVSKMLLGLIGGDGHKVDKLRGDDKSIRARYR